MDYDELNNIIKSYIDDKSLSIYLDNLDEVVKLAFIIFNNYHDTDILTYKDSINIFSSKRIATKFFENIDIEYQKRFLYTFSEKDMLQGKIDDTVVFTKIPKELTYKFRRSGVDDEGRIYIDYNETLEDIFNIVHEFSHKFSFTKNCNSSLKKFFGEVPSILSELLLEKMLLEKTVFSKDEIFKFKKNRFNSVYEDSKFIIIEYILIKLYLEYGRIDEEILTNYLNSLDTESELYQFLINEGVSYLKNIIKNGNIDFYNRQRYVIGLLFSIKLMKDYDRNKYISILNSLKNDDTSYYEDAEVLSKFIPIIDVENKRITIDNSMIYELSTSFSQFCDSLTNKSFGSSI